MTIVSDPHAAPATPHHLGTPTAANCEQTTTTVASASDTVDNSADNSPGQNADQLPTDQTPTETSASLLNSPTANQQEIGARAIAFLEKGQQNLTPNPDPNAKSHRILTSSGTQTLNEIALLLQEPRSRLAPPTQQIRAILASNGKDHKKYKDAKAKLPAIMPSLATTAGEPQALPTSPPERDQWVAQRHTGLYAFDIDTILEQLPPDELSVEQPKLRQELLNHPCIVAVAVSVGGKGLWCIAAGPRADSERQHKDYWNGIAASLPETAQANCHAASKNPNRLRYLGHDPDLKLNPNPIPWTPRAIGTASKTPIEDGSRRLMNQYQDMPPLHLNNGNGNGKQPEGSPLEYPRDVSHDVSRNSGNNDHNNDHNGQVEQTEQPDAKRRRMAVDYYWYTATEIVQFGLERIPPQTYPDGHGHYDTLLGLAASAKACGLHSSECAPWFAASHPASPHWTVEFPQKWEHLPQADYDDPAPWVNAIREHVDPDFLLPGYQQRHYKDGRAKHHARNGHSNGNGRHKNGHPRQATQRPNHPGPPGRSGNPSSPAHVPATRVPPAHVPATRIPPARLPATRLPATRRILPTTLSLGLRPRSRGPAASPDADA